MNNDALIQTLQEKICHWCADKDNYNFSSEPHEREDGTWYHSSHRGDFDCDASRLLKAYKELKQEREIE